MALGCLMRNVLVLAILSSEVYSQRADFYGVKDVWEPEKGGCSRGKNASISCGDGNLCMYSVDLHRKELLQCVSRSSAFFCVEPRWFGIVLWLGFTTPLILSIIVTFCFLRKREVCPPFSVYVETLFMAIVWSLFLTGAICSGMSSAVNRGAVYMIVIPVYFYLMWAMAICVCSCSIYRDGDCSSNFVRTIMRSDVMKRSDFAQYLTGVRQMAPIIELSGDYVKRMGKRSERVPFKEVFPYVSWEERSEGFVLPEKGMIVVHLVCNCHLSSSLHQKACERRDSMIAVVGSIHYSHFVKCEVQAIVPEIKEYVLVSFDGKVPKIVSFCNSCFGSFLWVLSRLCVFRSFIESIFCIPLGSMEINFEKHLSDDPDLHCPGGELDIDVLGENEGPSSFISV
jgi:hypothetical protein